jgi:hypothetical protein
MDDFNPTEYAFDKYNATFPEGYGGFGYVELVTIVGEQHMLQ